MENLSLPRQVARMDQERLRSYRSHLDFYNGLQWQGSAQRGE
jgi:hypothetical protein